MLGAMAPDLAFVESERSDAACTCGCGRRWLVSRGEVRHQDQAVAFVAMPTIHGADRVWWLAIELAPGVWACTRTWRDRDHVTAVVVDGDRTPVTELPRFAAGAAAVRGREDVIGDPAVKARLFGFHDAVLRNHPDVRHLFDREHGRDFSFKMPDCVFALPPDQRSPRNQENFAERDDRVFVRALVPVALADGEELRIGVWVEVTREAFFALLRVFWDDDAAYAALRLTGTVENSLPIAGHDLRGAAVTLKARDPSQCLFVAESATPWLAELLRSSLSVATLPDLLADVRRAMGRHVS